MRTLLTDGRVLTPAGVSEAILVDDTTVAWTGAVADAPTTYDRRIDLDGALVTPGFVDAHVHLSQTGLTARSLTLSSTLSLAQALIEVEGHCARSTSRLALVDGWDESRWPERRPFTRHEVDAVAHGCLVYLGRVDGHSAVVSTSLAEQVPGLREADGWHDDGLVSRHAHHLVRDALAELQTVEERTTDIRHALRQAAGLGITHVHEAAAPHIAPFDDLALIRQVCADEPLPRVVAYWGAWCGGEADAHGDRLHGYAGDLNVDGSIGSRTAALLDEYADADHAGQTYLTAEQVAEHLVHCTRQGLQGGFHVIGDAGMARVVAGLRAAADTCGPDAVRAARHRLEHAELIDPSDVPTLAELDVVVSAQPAFDAAWGGDGALYEQRLGRERMQRTNPFRAYADAGVRLAFGSDSPVTPLDPWGGVAAATHHRTPRHALTLAEAFAAHTVGGHHAAGDDAAGVLAPGREASYAVWAWDGQTEGGLPVVTDAARPTCLATVVAGQTVFGALA